MREEFENMVSLQTTTPLNVYLIVIVPAITFSFLHIQHKNEKGLQ